jgi:hypothetical protein
MFDSVRQPDAFNYIQDLRVIFVAFGITKILQGLGWVVERRRTHGIFWVHTLGAVLVGCLQLQFAWASYYDYRISEWPFGGFLLACATPLIYLFIGYLLFPDSPSEEHDFIKTYSSNIRLIAALAIVAQIVNSLMDYRFHSGEARLWLQHFIRGVSSLVLCGFFLPFPRFRRVHEIVVVVLIVALVLSCLFLTPSIKIQ